MSKSKSTTQQPSAAERPDFEQALEELENLVTRLESGDLSLDQSLAHFSRGVELTKTCQTILDDAQKTIDLLAEKDGGPVSADIEPGD